MFGYMREHTEDLHQTSELLEDSIISLISKVGINLQMSNDHDKDSSLHKTIFEITQKNNGNSNRK